MGAYLTSPKTKITGRCEENDLFAYSSAEMQGWRKNQEDAHTAILNYDDKGTAFFAVFDGHGGDEVSKYCAMNLADYIRKSSLYQSDKIIEALEDSFLKFDQTLKEPNVFKTLQELADKNDDETLEELDHDETINLKLDAKIPVQDVINNIKYYYDKEKEQTAGSSSSVSGSSSSASGPSSSASGPSTSTTDLSSSSLTSTNNKTEDPEKPNLTDDQKEPSNFLYAAVRLLKENTLQAFLQDFSSDDDENDEDVQVNYEDEDEDEDDDEDEDEDEDKDEDEDEDEDEENDDEEMSQEEEEEEEKNVEDGQEDEEEKGTDYLCSKFFNVANIPGKTSGCTAIVALIRGQDLYVANVGDSRCVLSREGKAINMSHDHKPEDKLEKQRITKAGGSVTSDGRINAGLNLSRAIGDHAYKTNETVSDKEQMITALPDVKHIQIDPEKDEFLFIACDGIWNSMSSQKVVSFINKRLKDEAYGFDLKRICHELFKVCLAPNTDGDGSGCDNMTCILILFKKNPKPILNNVAGTSSNNICYVTSLPKKLRPLKRNYDELEDDEVVENVGFDNENDNGDLDLNNDPISVLKSNKRNKIIPDSNNSTVTINNGNGNDDALHKQEGSQPSEQNE